MGNLFLILFACVSYISRSLNWDGREIITHSVFALPWMKYLNIKLCYIQANIWHKDGTNWSVRALLIISSFTIIIEWDDDIRIL